MRRASLIYAIALIVASICLAQPVERPPRPGETVKRQPENKRPAVDRAYRKIDKLRPAFGLSGGVFIIPKGSFATLSAGVNYGRFGLGAELSYADYERDFTGSKRSFVSPGDSSVTERGSFVCPAFYGEYEIVSGKVKIVPRATIGYCDMTIRRWYSSSPDDKSLFLRERFVNTLELNIEFPIGPVAVAGTVQWWVINPWFFVHPDYMGMLAAGISIGY